MLAALLLAGGLGWGGFVLIVLPGRYSVGGDAVFGWALALTAFLLGVRHGFDVDHIAAIDNTVRRLVAERRESLSVGFWFALGHSAVVLVAVGLLAAGVEAVAHGMSRPDSAVALVSSAWGSAISGVFLVVVGLVNLASFRGALRLYRAPQTGATEGGLERFLDNRGLLNRVLRRIAARVDTPWKMFPIGVLFGLGLDTASTVVLLVAGGGSAARAPWYVVMMLPVLFTAGMCLVDTVDGLLMNRAYRWAGDSPDRKAFYSLTVTAMSVAVALAVGSVELAALAAGLVPEPPHWLSSVAHLSLDNVGYVVVVLLASTWVVAAIVWQLRTRGPALQPRGRSRTLGSSGAGSGSPS